MVTVPALDELVGSYIDAAGGRWSITDVGAAHTLRAPADDVVGLVLGPAREPLVAALLSSVGVAPRVDTAAALGVTALEDSERSFQVLARCFGAAECAVWVQDATTLRSISDADRAPPEAARASADSGLPVLVDDGRAVSTWFAAWCARAPGDEPVGLLALRANGAWAPGALRGELAAIAIRLGIELSWLRIHQCVVAEHASLRAAVMIEPLTGALTRAAFERTVAVELAAARRRAEALSLVVFDVDDLRRINDLHGHPAGDALLAQLATLLRANIRVNDVVGRIGGDELAVLLMNANLAQARAVAEKLVKAAMATRVVAGGDAIQFSLRAGCTTFDVEAERDGDAGFTRAIHALDGAATEPRRVATVSASMLVPDVLSLDDDAQVDMPLGQTLEGGYRIVHEISRGASGVVYRGEDLGLGRPVAIKVLRHDLGRDAALVEHFRREATILASLRHPNLVQVYAFGTSYDVYFVMELVEGPTIADIVDQAVLRNEWLDVGAVGEVITEVADALDAMHAAGLVHCDVKPENILLDRAGGRAVLVDIGECKRHDESRRRAGTPGYAAPESFSAGDETVAIDVYSLAATAYLMLTARLPFGVGDALAILTRQLDAPAPAPSSIRRCLPAAVDVVIAKAMSVDPAARYTSPAAFATALVTALRASAPDVQPLIPAHVGHLRALTVDAHDKDADLGEDDSTPVVRGAAFRVAAKVLAARAGEPGLRRLAERRQDLAEVLAPGLAALSWQPVGLLLDLVSAIATPSIHADVLRTIGRGLVSVTFGYLYGADPTTMSTHGLLETVPALWSQYFGVGAAEIVGAGDGRVVLSVHGWSAEPAASQLVAGVLERIAEFTGATGIEVTVFTKDDAQLYTVQWDGTHE